jgi:hypothetical protein
VQLAQRGGELGDLDSREAGAEHVVELGVDDALGRGE